MANKLFRPHRGGVSKMNVGTGSTHVLEDGEFFVEYPDTGSGSGKCKVKMGNGVAPYTELPYALGDTSTDPITFTEASSTTVEAALARVISGAALQNIIGGLRRAVSLCNTRITTEVNTLKENFQVGVDAVYDAVVAKGSTPASKSLSDVIEGINGIRTRTIHTQPYTFPVNDTGGTKDLTADHEYRYVNATNVYNKGKADGKTVHTETYPLKATEITKDLTADHKYRWINATNVYNKGKADGKTVHTKTYPLAANEINKDLKADHNYRYINASNVYNSGYNSGVAAGKNSVHNSMTTGGASWACEEDHKLTSSYTVPSNAVGAYATCSMYNRFGSNNNTGVSNMYLNGSLIATNASVWTGFVSAGSVFYVDINNDNGSNEGTIYVRIVVFYWTA